MGAQVHRSPTYPLCQVSLGCGDTLLTHSSLLLHWCVQTTTMLMASDGVVLEPSQADLAAAANASDPSTAWLGCIVAEGALMDGSVVAVADGVATAEDCCRACRANSKCNVWNHCSQQGGCRWVARPGSYQRACEALHQCCRVPTGTAGTAVLASSLDLPLLLNFPAHCSFAASSPLLGQFTVNLTQGQCECPAGEVVHRGEAEWASGDACCCYK